MRNNTPTSYMSGISRLSVLLSCFILTLIQSPLTSQEIRFGCDLDVECHNYFGTTHFGEFLVDPPGSPCSGALCGTQPTADVPPIYAFYALDESISLSITANGGVYFAVVEPSDFGDCIVAGWHCENDNSSVETDDLIVGELYYIVFTPCGEPPTVPATEFEIVIGENETQVYPLIIGMWIDFAGNSECDFDPETIYCPGIDLSIFAIGDDGISTTILEGTQLVFAIYSENYEEVIVVDAEDSGILSFIPEVPGTYTVELIEIYGLENCSESFSYRTIIEDAFIIGEQETIELGEYNVCESDLMNGFFPPRPWEGETIYKAGTYFSPVGESCECEAIQKVIVNQIDLEAGEVILELCPQNLPYQLNEEIIINAGDNIDGNYYEIEEGSLQEDFNQEYCDSLFQLFVTFVDDQNTCNQCELAYSVKLDNLVACIPFDNSELDVSLNENHSELLNGAAFFEDRFGNPDFATNLDGIDDIIEIDHSEAFLDDQFSFSFWFNKPEKHIYRSEP